MNTPEMRAIQNARLTELASIKGKTIEELELEIKDTEAKLEKLKASRQKLHEELRQVTSNVAAGAKSQADVIFLRDDLRLEDKKIMIVLDKLKRMQDQIAQLRTADETARDTFAAREREGKEKKANKKRRSLRSLFKRSKRREENPETEDEEEYEE